MSNQPTVRRAEPDDAARVREIAESTFTQAYALSPQDIEAILDAKFVEDDLQSRFERDDTTLVAENDGVLAGFARLDVDDGTIRWLHVDPERRGLGVGTTLFEAAVDELESQGVETVRGVVLSSNTAAGAFFERFGYGKTDEWRTEIDGLDVVEYTFTAQADVESDDRGNDAAREGDREEWDPENVASDLPDTATADGEEVYLGDDVVPGTEGGFVSTYTDDERTTEHGYYCTNCGSTAVSVDSMERLECQNCGNVRRPDDDYDGSYL
ncbi:Ribosomal protein S18 acetylase RimI [Halogranum amylolyticum]|uniref:Ribosomal protein S18 acetylase RimI n=1 Tax=Halogranum amylolyticum TaxID=660520 RepID=A0A1H8NM32_9EURY|nr:GNAT family N-acetyltransferase [Halogranum amylolyticum]SEO30443.1 Ribosomal protein S18 acetylase RimI [Halogranum amylolyticum]